jgi:heme exporter protein A
MSNYSLEVNNVKKSFGRRLIFNNLSFYLNESKVFGITGLNGSGKSTLVKILAGINSATDGKITHRFNEKEILPEELHNYIGFVSPYLFLYDEFSSRENLVYFSKIRDVKYDSDKVDFLLAKFLLDKRKDDLVKTYSSGMKQRLKFIFALMHSPKLIILDEPTSNLDEEGKETVYQLIEAEGKNGIVIVASNEERDLLLCKEKIKLEDYKK